jgi:myo-inositol 2-dehydrogenase/D-chiro-inositol 1-dehydrogenase
MLQISNLTDTTVQLFSKDVSAAGEPYMDFFLERYATAYRNELALFIEGIGSGKNLGSTYDDGRAALILADAAHESARTGKAVRVKLD